MKNLINLDSLLKNCVDSRSIQISDRVYFNNVIQKKTNSNMKCFAAVSLLISSAAALSVDKAGNDCDCIGDFRKSGDECDCIGGRKPKLGSSLIQAHDECDCINGNRKASGDCDCIGSDRKPAVGLIQASDECDCINGNRKAGDECDCIGGRKPKNTINLLQKTKDECDCINGGRKARDECDCIDR